MSEEKAAPNAENGAIESAPPSPARRRIDDLRDSAISMEIGSADDPSPIKDMIVIGGSMHMVKDKGVYRFQTADEIDPGRNNASLPSTQQRVLSFGADCEFVRQTLLTAQRLFKSKLLGPTFDYDRPLVLTFEALKDIIAMHEMRLALDVDLEEIIADLRNLATKNRGLSVPAVGDIRVRVETFLQKVDHAVADLFEIAKLFYPNEVGRRWFDSLLDIARTKYGPDANFTKFLVEALPFLRFVRNARNCVEHPKPTERLEIHDITLLPSGELRRPVLEIIHPDTPQPTIDVDAFMKHVTEQVAGTFELMLCFLCGFNIEPFAGLPVQVVRYPDDLQKAFGVRYGYGVVDAAGNVIPFG